MSDAVQIERDGATALLRLNRPDTRNALSGDVIDAIAEFLDRANDDSSLSCIILTGNGDAFSSGGNVKEMHEGGHPMFSGSPLEMQEGYRNHIQRLPRLFDRLDVPVIAAVNGHAIGAGMDLATMCDIRVASTSARFAESARWPRLRGRRSMVPAAGRGLCPRDGVGADLPGDRCG